jgi:hypothetical protein
VHAVLARQRLDEVLERHVAAHVVRHPDRALHLQDARGESRVERLEVEAQLGEEGVQGSAPLARGHSFESSVETPEGLDACTLVELGFEGADGFAADAGGEGGRGGLVVLVGDW